MTLKPTTLGEELAGSIAGKPGQFTSAWFRQIFLKSLNSALLACIGTLISWWFVWRPVTEIAPVLILWSVLFVASILLSRMFRKNKQHFLLTNDRQGFMRDLRLDEKTAVIDGSNIYHLGRENGLDAQPLGEVAYLLRSQGYRIVCFFDANIFHTLCEHGAFSRTERHSFAMLERVFGLSEDEIYVVPSGVQADRFILECLKYMPISFAVTNDRFRDYANQYAAVMRDDLWRKGVAISGNEVKLLQHRV